MTTRNTKPQPVKRRKITAREVSDFLVDILEDPKTSIALHNIVTDFVDLIQNEALKDQRGTARATFPIYLQRAIGNSRKGAL